jgi:hypothetical protein
MRVLNLIALYIAVTNAWSNAPKTGKKFVTKNEYQTKFANTFAAALLVSSISIFSITPPVEASTLDSFAGSPEIVLALRSGGRAGGRAGGGSYARSSRMAPAPVYRQSTTIIRPMIATPPPVVISPFGGGFGYGYNPLGGVGLGYSLGAMNSYGNEIRDYRQEAEIQKEKAELEIAKEKNAELEARIKALEQSTKALPSQQ